MITITPVASGFLAADDRERLVARLSGHLREAGVAHRLAPAGGSAPHDELPVVLVLTGGTERAALQAVDAALAADPALPVVLVAHPSQNSFPACLEILARLRQLGRRGEIVCVGDGDLAPSRTPGDDHDGEHELRRLAAAAGARARLRGRRLGVVGRPSDWLVASEPDADAVAAAWGVELVEVDLRELLDAVPDVPATETGWLVDELVAGAAAVVEPTSADLQQAAAVLVALRGLLTRHRLDACTVRCFDLVTRQRTTGCFALSQLNDEGLVAGCEGDVPATLTMMWLNALSGDATFMANPQQVDITRGRLWLSHCTIGRSLLDGYRLRSHFESGLGVALEGRLAPQPVTVARLGGADLRQAFVADGQLVAMGTSPDRCRTQVEVQVDADLGLLLRQPLGNHHVLARGHWARELEAYRRLFLG